MNKIINVGERCIGENPKWDLSTRDIKLKAEEVFVGSGKYIAGTSINYELQPAALYGINTGLPAHWRLDLHQSIVADGVGRYVYTDGDGFQHVFIKYVGEENKYFDADGAGLTLDAVAQTITDESGNYLKFVDGRLKQITKAKTSVTTDITYDTAGMIKGVACGNSVIDYNYADGKLQTITCKINGNTIRQLKLVYAGEKLSEIRLSAGDTEVSLKAMTYDEAGCLSMISDGQNSEAIIIVNEQSGGQYRATEVGQGYVRNAVYTSLYKNTVTNLQFSAGDPQKVTEVCVSNENGIKLTYMLSEDGRIAGRMEGNMTTGYKTLEKRYGTALEYSGVTSAGAGTINGRPVARISGSVQPVVPAGSAEKLSESTYLSLNFYLRHSESDKRIFAKLTVNGNSMEGVEADCRARNIWQKVSIPFRRPTSGISTVKLDLTDNTGSVLTADVCDIRLTESEYAELKVASMGIDFRDITIFRCKYGNGTADEYDNSADGEWYMTAADYMRTLKNKNRCNGAEFDAYFGNGKLRRKISDITIYDPQTQSNISLLSGAPVSKVTSSDGKSSTETTYTYTSGGCTAESSTEIEYLNADRIPSTRQFITSESYDYDGGLINRTADNGTVTNYDYFSDGRLRKVTLSPQSGAEVVVCEYTEDSFGRLKESHAGCMGETYIYNNSDGSIDRISEMSYNNGAGKYVLTGFTRNYEYDGYGNLTGVVFSDGGEHEMTYDGLKLRSVTDGQVKYMYSRDLHRNADAFNVYDETLFYDSDYSGTGEVILYEKSMGKTASQTAIAYRYGENDSYIYNRIYDEYDRAKSVTRGGAVKETYDYESGTDSGYARRVTKITDADSGVNYEFEYADDKLSKTVRTGFTAEYSGGVTTYNLSGKGALARAESAPCGRTEKVSYYEEFDGEHVPDTDKFGCECKYNEYGQLIKRTMADETGTQLHNYTYDYAVNGTGVPVPVELRYRRYLSTQLYDITEAIGYDSRWNISSINRTFLINNEAQNYAGDIKSYEYESSNRISREKISYNGKDYITEYEYDENGRLKQKKDIRRSGAATEKEDEYNYTYDRFGRLKQCAKTIDGEKYTDSYSYNDAGNRTDQRQAEKAGSGYEYIQKQFVWTRGKLLEKYIGDGATTTYKYDYADRLVKRTTGSSTTEYYYDGDRLVAQTTPGAKIYYFYDDVGVSGAEYNGEYYEFVRNILGDIVAVIKGIEVVGRYDYDPFGVCTEYTQNTFVKLNPFRYRGYFCDTVTGMYLLKTRYYDPVTAQFLSLDHPDYLDPDTHGGIDLYGYCNNNPISYVDPDGSIAISAILLAMLGGAIWGGVSSGIQAANNGLSVGKTILAILGGAIMGAAVSGAFALGGAAATGLTIAGNVVKISGATLFAIASYSTAVAGIIDYQLNSIAYDRRTTSDGYFISAANGFMEGIASFTAGLFAGLNGYFRYIDQKGLFKANKNIEKVFRTVKFSIPSMIFRNGFRIIVQHKWEVYW